MGDINDLKNTNTKKLSGVILGKSVLNKRNYKVEYVLFDQCIFQEEVSFEDLDIFYGARFFHCIFNKQVKFESINSSKDINGMRENNTNLIFENCEFNKDFKLLKSEITKKKIVFKNSKFAGKFTISDCRIQEGIVFNNNSFNEMILNIVELDECIFRSNDLNEKVTFLNINCIILRFQEKNTFKKELILKDCTIVAEILFSDSYYSEMVKLTNLNSSKAALNFRNSQFSNSIIIEKERNFKDDSTSIFAKTLEINSSQFIGGLFINGYLGNNKTILPGLRKMHFGEITIFCSNELKGNIEFVNIDIAFLEISGPNKDSTIVIRDCYLKKGSLREFMNYKGLMLSNVYPSSSEFKKIFNFKNDETIFEIINSDLGESKFFNVDFESFSKIEIRNSKISEISAILIKWFLPKSLNTIYLHQVKEAIKHPSHKYETFRNEPYKYSDYFQTNCEIYRQLKITSQKEGNIPQALEFQKNEMTFYRKALKSKRAENKVGKKGYNNISTQKDWSFISIVALLKEKSENIILWTNRSNDYGQNWIKALLLLITFNFIFFIPIALFSSSDLNHAFFDPYNFGQTCNVIFLRSFFKYWILLNPTHRIENISELGKNSGLLYFLDFLSRIIVSYFYFQIISAFRKFNK